MNKLRDILCAIIIIWLISMNLEDMFKDVMQLKSEQHKYILCEVTIEREGHLGDRHNRIAYFTYNEIEGYVVCNFWEHVGDKIEVAYDGESNFIRTQLCMNDHSPVSWMLCMIGIVAIVYDVNNGLKETNRLDRFFDRQS